MRKLSSLLPILFIVIVAGCHKSPASPSSGGGPVTLVFTVDSRLFADAATLNVEVWNAAALAALDANAGCATVSGPAGGSTIQCPPGVVFVDVVPERFVVPVSATAEVTAQEVAGGERFRIHLGAMSRDGCNMTFADLVRVATAGRTVLGDLAWQTTARGCLD